MVCISNSDHRRRVCFSFLRSKLEKWRHTLSGRIIGSENESGLRPLQALAATSREEYVDERRALNIGLLCQNQNQKNSQPKALDRKPRALRRAPS